jgi:hypothetical protein
MHARQSTPASAFRSAPTAPSNTQFDQPHVLPKVYLTMAKQRPGSAAAAAATGAATAAATARGRTHSGSHANDDDDDDSGDDDHHASASMAAVGTSLAGQTPAGSSAPGSFHGHGQTGVSSRIAALQKILAAQSGPRVPIKGFVGPADPVPLLPRDPNAPEANGPFLRPLLGVLPAAPGYAPPVFLTPPPTRMHSLCERIAAHALAHPKQPAFSVVDGRGKVAKTLTFAKLFKQVQAMAGALHRFVPGCGAPVPPRIALVFPLHLGTSSTLSYIVTFLAVCSEFVCCFSSTLFLLISTCCQCMWAGCVPVRVAFPERWASSEDAAGIARMGFLLSAVGATVALTDKQGGQLLFDKRRRMLCTV